MTYSNTIHQPKQGNETIIEIRTKPKQRKTKQSNDSHSVTRISNLAFNEIIIFHRKLHYETWIATDYDTVYNVYNICLITLLFTVMFMEQWYYKYDVP